MVEQHNHANVDVLWSNVNQCDDKRDRESKERIQMLVQCIAWYPHQSMHGSMWGRNYLCKGFVNESLGSQRFKDTDAAGLLSLTPGPALFQIHKVITQRKVSF